MTTTEDGAHVALVNLTPHPVDVVTVDGRVVRIEAQPRPARLEVISDVTGALPIDGSAVPLVSERMGDPIDLPEEAPGRLLVVSRTVMEHLPHRRDLVTPTDLVRDAAGRVVGCRAFASLGSTSPSG